MGNALDAPKTEKDSHLFESIYGMVGVAGMQGWRSEMEDSHVAFTIPSLKDHIFLGVFDGHGGQGAAIFLAEMIVEVLEDSMEWKIYREDPLKKPLNLGNAISVAFMEIDMRLKTRQQASKGLDNSGCTGVVCIITPHHYVCANVGDSRCVLGSDGDTFPLSADHKPGDEEEDRRVYAAGGVVNWKRIDGELAVSRAFGDFDYKSRDLEPKNQKVSCYPDIRVLERNKEDEVLILACDGVWDVMSSSQAVRLCLNIHRRTKNARKVAEELISNALNKGSNDNISAIVMLLPGIQNTIQ